MLSNFEGLHAIDPSALGTTSSLPILPLPSIKIESMPGWHQPREQLMGILSDQQILELCREESFITPYFTESVKIEGEKKVISYGVSSYGYDMRLAPEFMIFSNATQSDKAYIDPKDFDEKAYIRHEGDYVIIPPNGFVLGRSIEYIKMPPDLTGIVLGKSTYARCFTGDTKVALVDGTSASFLELIERAGKGERFWGYSMDLDGKVAISELTAPRKIGHEKVIKVVLDNGEVIKATPDHKFMLKTGEWIEAKDLKVSDSLMPLYRFVSRGYEAVVHPLDSTWCLTHRLSDQYNIRYGVYIAGERQHRHHVDHDRRNNKPENVRRVCSNLHLVAHNAEYWGNEENRNKASKVQKDIFEKNSADEAWYQALCEKLARASTGFWNDDKYSEKRAIFIQRRKDRDAAMSHEERQRITEKMRIARAMEQTKLACRQATALLWTDPDYRAMMCEKAGKINIREDITEKELRQALDTEKSIRGAAKSLNCDRTVFRRFRDVILEFKAKWDAAKHTQIQMLGYLRTHGSITKTAKALNMGRGTITKYYKEAVTSFFGSPVAENHKVAAIEMVDGEHDVFCLTAPEFGNFALEAGVFVKNCGLTTLATPLEAGWHGHITLEFSNTTPRPIKMYAREGCVQVLFIRGAPCMVNYATRGGKYQGQTGITLPKT
jgi:deoxycytidine triphosphate deaminase